MYNVWVYNLCSVIHINYHKSYRILTLQVLYCTNDGRLTRPPIPLSLSYQKQKNSYRTQMCKTLKKRKMLQLMIHDDDKT